MDNMEKFMEYCQKNNIPWPGTESELYKAYMFGFSSGKTILADSIDQPPHFGAFLRSSDNIEHRAYMFIDNQEFQIHLEDTSRDSAVFMINCMKVALNKLFSK